MCGIVGYIGHKEAYPVLIKGLRRLEYRGYDSAGVALINSDGNLNVYKTKGKVDNLTEYCSDKNVSGSVGIAHTRWATHGEPSSRNAHPHYSQSHNLAIIHNGIIENYADIKQKLIEKGVAFQSDTDTEVLGFGIKLQLLHVIRGTDLEKDYLADKFECMTMEEYISLIHACIDILPDNIVVHRITGDGAKKTLVAPLWSADKKRVLNALK